MQYRWFDRTWAGRLVSTTIFQTEATKITPVVRRPPGADGSQRLPGLDLVRALAIAWVMLYHASILWHVPGDSWIVRFGWMGVDLFFVLSGFLIAGQLLRPWARGAAPNYPRFITRRLLRTIPAYLVVLALYFRVPWLRDGLEIQPLWQFLTFTQNLFLDATPRKVFSHVWSLCVEEQFYLVFPLVVAGLAFRPAPRRSWQPSRPWCCSGFAYAATCGSTAWPRLRRASRC